MDIQVLHDLFTQQHNILFLYIKLETVIVIQITDIDKWIISN